MEVLYMNLWRNLLFFTCKKSGRQSLLTRIHPGSEEGRIEEYSTTAYIIAEIQTSRYRQEACRRSRAKYNLSHYQRPTKRSNSSRSMRSLALSRLHCLLLLFPSQCQSPLYQRYFLPHQNPNRLTSHTS